MSIPTFAELVRPDLAQPELMGLLFRSRAGLAQRAFVVVHGAGLDFRASLYVGLAGQLADECDVYLTGIRASSLINYNDGFRAPQGWAHHTSQAAREDLGRWLTWLGQQGYGSIRLVGHSWGGLVALAAAIDFSPRGMDIALVSPIPSLGSLLTTNYGITREEYGSLIATLESMEEPALYPTKAGSPLGVVSVGTIRDLVTTDWELLDLARSWSQPLLVVSGQKEHAQLLGGLDELARQLPKHVTRDTIRGAGHFYTHHHVALAVAIARWDSKPTLSQKA